MDAQELRPGTALEKASAKQCPPQKGCSDLMGLSDGDFPVSCHQRAGLWGQCWGIEMRRELAEAGCSQAVAGAPNLHPVHAGPCPLGSRGTRRGCPGRVTRNSSLGNRDPRSLRFPPDVGGPLPSPASLHHSCIPGLRQPPVRDLQVSEMQIFNQ